MPFTPIHRALGAEPSEITVELLRQAAATGVPETADLEWKHTYNHRNPRGRDELAKDIAAMANSGGGTIVYGVAEDPDRKDLAGDVVGTRLPDGLDQMLHQVAWNDLRPSLSGIHHTVVPIEGDLSVLVVEVPGSPDAPHLVMREQQDDRRFLAPQRAGAHTVFMTERDLERAYRERFTRYQRTEQTVDRLFEQASRETHRDKVRFVGVAVPHAPVGRGRMERRAARAIVNTAQSSVNDLLDDGWSDAVELALGGWDVRNRLRRWTHSRRRHDQRVPERVVSVHFDGAIALTFDVDINQPFEVSSPYMEALLASVLSLSRASGQRLLYSGLVEIKVGLVWDDPEQSVWVLPQAHAWRGSSRLDGVPTAQFEPLIATVPLDVDGEAFMVLTRELALDLVNIGGVTRLYALREPETTSAPPR